MAYGDRLARRTIETVVVSSGLDHYGSHSLLGGAAASDGVVGEGRHSANVEQQVQGLRGIFGFLLPSAYLRYLTSLCGTHPRYRVHLSHRVSCPHLTCQVHFVYHPGACLPMDSPLPPQKRSLSCEPTTPSPSVSLQSFNGPLRDRYSYSSSSFLSAAAALPGPAIWA